MILEFWQGAGDPIRGLAAVVRALGYMGCLGAMGAALFLVFMSEQLTYDEARAARRWLVLLMLLGLLASLALWPLRAAELSGIRDGAFRWQLYPQIARSPFGDSFFLRASGLILVLFALVRTTWGAGVATAGALLVAMSYVAVGHAAAFRPRQELSALIIMHIVAVAFWFGSLFPLRNVTLRRDPRSSAEAIQVWSRYALAFTLLALVTGGWGALLVAGPPMGLTRSGFGWALIAKLALVTAMLFGALACRFRHVRLMARGDVLAGDAFRRSVGWQILFAILALYATAEMVSVDLPALPGR
jgi:putative copper resistance protein D